MKHYIFIFCAILALLFCPSCIREEEPDNTPVNIANPADLRRLKEMFPNEELYIVVGSDVIHNASSYKKEPEENSIHFFNHIVFRRA